MSVTSELELLNQRRTKIVATLGPASSDESQIRALVEAGVNMFRLNMSHGTHDVHERTIQNVRQAAREAGRHIPILADLAGPKIRIGSFKDGSIELEEGTSVIVTVASPV